jgi:CO/xanthine dehydrogenase FAD-binding subunit
MRYLRPTRLADAITALSETGGRALAGGTDLLVRTGREQPWPAGLVDLKALPELHELRLDGSTLRIGAGLPLADLITAPELTPFPILREAMGVFAARQIRERATLGGNLANASPAADTLPPLLCHDARCVTDRRVIPVGGLATGPGETCLAVDELIIAIELPLPAPSSRGFFHKLAPREAMAISRVTVCGLLELVEGEVAELRIALGAVAPTVIRARKAEDELRGGALEPERIARAAAVAAAECSPITDLRAGADYRRSMVERLLGYELNRLRG